MKLIKRAFKAFLIGFSVAISVLAAMIAVAAVWNYHTALGVLALCVVAGMMVAALVVAIEL